MRRRLLFGLGSFAFAWLLTGTVSGWAQSTPTAIEIPRNATALEGVPQVRFAYTHLSSTEPGTYVRFTERGNRLLYVEHLDMPFGSVTFWGELRIVLEN
jgi:hypothetical protein